MNAHALSNVPSVHWLHNIELLYVYVTEARNEETT